MMLHLGGGEMVPLKHVIAILDLDAARSTDAAAFLRGFESPPGSRSAVVTHIRGKTSIYPSPLSSLTLLRRSRAASQGNQHDEGGSA